MLFIKTHDWMEIVINTHLVSPRSTYDFFIFDSIVKVPLDDVDECQEHFDDCFRKSFHVTHHYFRIRTFELLDHIETLGQLGEDVDHRVGKQRVLAALLELCVGQRGTG